MNKGKEVAKPLFVSVIPSPILAKSEKEVKEILKFFKKIDKPTSNKLYAQTLLPKSKPDASSSDIAINTLKIKEAFPNLPNKKIDSIQKIVNSLNDKPKPRLNMTMKGPSHKQVIVPMNNNLGKSFTKTLHPMSLTLIMLSRVSNLMFVLTSYMQIIKVLSSLLTM